MRKKIWAGGLAVVAAGATVAVVAVTGGTSGAATGDNASPASTAAAPKAPANGVYNYASPQHPVYWGCANGKTNGLVGGRFYEYDGPDAAAPLNRYPGCATWAKRVAWDGHSLQESTRINAAGLVIDGAPGDSGNGGSGGWGWNSAAKAPVTSVRVGTTASLTVTALQSAPEANASITLSWDPDDFKYVGNGDSTATCAAPDSTAGVETCTYTDFAHSAKGDNFQFEAERANPDAVVTATVNVGAKQASATFPVQLAAAVK
jgi:hypothetical protein